MGKHGWSRPMACIQMEKRPFGQRNYIGHCRWCFMYRKGPSGCNYIGGRIRRSVLSKTQGTQKRIGGSDGLFNLKGSVHSDKSDFQEKLSKPDDVTTSKPRLASECSMKKRLGFKASLRACSARIRSSEFDIQEKLSKPDDVTTSTPHIAKQLRSSSKMRFLHYKRKALKMMKKPVMIKRKANSTT